MGSKPRLTGYRRENGTMGIRNHVIILPLDDLSNAAAEAVAKVIPGTMALPHAFGRLQFGEDLQLSQSGHNVLQMELQRLESQLQLFQLKARAIYKLFKKPAVLQQCSYKMHLVLFALKLKWAT
jgi:hypothetical protein